MKLRYLALVPLLTAAVPAAEPAPILPTVPPGFVVQLIAREPLVRNPCAMAFDTRGRLFVGQGPQYRNPKPNTPGDTIEILIDSDGDGIADKTKTFARGLNCIQGLAWHGRDLWVANAPDLTIVRDLDGDDVADEYVQVYTDLGNIEHALHGLNWAPDGRLYMSKGTSKGLTQPGRVAPQAFRDLWGVDLPAGASELPVPVGTFKADNYKSTYQDPNDNWGKEGGILRCDADGTHLEIVSRGMRNPFDVGYDHAFNFLTTDNDQYDGDRIMMPFFGAHFGWSHSWSADWTGANHLPTVPVSGPVFPGSSSGIVYSDSPSLPPNYRGVWFMNDWLRKSIFVYRPVWDGALLQPQGGKWEEFAVGRTALFQPVDIEHGPDGALYVTGWGKSYGAVFKDGKQVNEGRIFRISWEGAQPALPDAAKRAKPAAQWTLAELTEDFASLIPARRIDAQDELVRRGVAIVPELTAWLQRSSLSTALETWGLWTLGRIAPGDSGIDAWFAGKGPALSSNARLQSLRIAGQRLHRTGVGSLPAFVTDALADAEPRVRFEAVQAVWQARQKNLASRLWDLAATETDRLTFYSAWQALRDLVSPADLEQHLADARGGVRCAALLALLEGDALAHEKIGKLITDPDARVAGVAALWQAKQSGNTLIIVDPAPKNFSSKMTLRLLAGIKPAAIRWTTDGSEPTAPKPGEAVREGMNLSLRETTTVKVALYVAGTAPAAYKKVGPTVGGTWTRLPDDPADALPVILQPASEPLTIPAVLPLVEKLVASIDSTAVSGGAIDLSANQNLNRGKRLFTAAGCIACHRVGNDGATFGPDLSAMGDKADPRHLIESMIEPNAIITEGFSLQVINTRDGKSYSGILRDETNRQITLIQPSGEPVSVEKAEITSRENLHQSIMPSFALAMSAEQMADLAAWLLSQRSEALQKTLSINDIEAQSAAARAASLSVAPATGFTTTLAGDRLTITDAGMPMASYVFKDAAVLRPALHNLHAPGGVLITRGQPPAAPDAIDHPAFHPGIWLGFGDINGADFWRNKARIEHERFVEPPTATRDTVAFRTLNRLVAPTGETIGVLDLAHRIARQSGAYLIEIEAKLSSPDRDLVFGDQEEMGLGVRLTDSLIEKKGGRVANSHGLVGAKEAWGRVADWCSYARTQDGRIRGAAIFASPTNGHRSWWHTRDYGLMVANAFGAKAQPAIPEGKLRLPRGQTLTLRYAVLLFDTLESSPPDYATIYRTFAGK